MQFTGGGGGVELGQMTAGCSHGILMAQKQKQKKNNKKKNWGVSSPTIPERHIAAPKGWYVPHYLNRW